MLPNESAGPPSRDDPKYDRVSQSNVVRDSCSTTNRPPPKASGKHTTSVQKTLGSRGVSL
jgi:hypothetical protein